MNDAPETLAEAAWQEFYEEHPPLETDQTARKRALHRKREAIARNIRGVVAVLRRMGWPNRWPRELMLTHRGRE